MGKETNQQDQCTPNSMINSAPSPTLKSTLYVTPVHKTTIAPTTMISLPNNNQMLPTANEMGTNTNLDSDNIRLEAETRIKKILAEEKVVQRDACTCVQNGKCPTEQMNFTFGKSCKIGTVRCCSTPQTTTSSTKTSTTFNTTPVSTTNTNREVTARAGTIVKTNSHQEKSISTNATMKLSTAASNHRLSGHVNHSVFKGYESPYHRYSVPSKTLTIYRSPMT